MKIFIPISVGELLDKITILEIKTKYTNNSSIHEELTDLVEIAKQHQVYDKNDIKDLKNINSELWETEDRLRELEKIKDFSSVFIEFARNVYILNDRRSQIKNEINKKTNSYYVEVKCYV